MMFFLVLKRVLSFMTTDSRIKICGNFQDVDMEMFYEVLSDDAFMLQGITLKKSSPKTVV